MVSSGDKTTKIRTYTYGQGRVTDHRIGLSLYDLPNILNANIQKIIDELILAENTEKLKQLSDGFLEFSEYVIKQKAIKLIREYF